MLASAYLTSLRLADDLGAHHVALPSLSTGVYGYPLEDGGTGRAGGRGPRAAGRGEPPAGHVRALRGPRAWPPIEQALETLVSRGG